MPACVMRAVRRVVSPTTLSSMFLFVISYRNIVLPLSVPTLRPLSTLHLSLEVFAWVIDWSDTKQLAGVFDRPRNRLRSSIWSKHALSPWTLAS